MVYMYHSFLIHSSTDGHLGCFHVLAMINSGAMNIGVHVSLSDLVSLVCMLNFYATAVNCSSSTSKAVAYWLPDFGQAAFPLCPSGFSPAI